MIVSIIYDRSYIATEVLFSRYEFNVPFGWIPDARCHQILYRIEFLC